MEGVLLDADAKPDDVIRCPKCEAWVQVDESRTPMMDVDHSTP